MKIEINERIVKKIKERIRNSNEFNSVDAYVNHILRQVVKRLENETKGEQVLSKKDEEEIKEKLSHMGYL